MSDDIVARLRLWSENAKEQDATDVVIGLSHAADEIDRITAERDEARRELCRNLMGPYGDEYKYAKHRGWDCFKEDGE